MKIPQEMYSVSFDKSRVFGYKPEEVDKYVSGAKAAMSELTAENDELTEKLEAVVKELQRYKEDEDSLKAALVGAQKLADSILKESKKKAAAVLAEADAKSAAVLADAQQKSEAALRVAGEKSDALLAEALEKHDAVLGELDSRLASEKKELESVQAANSLFKSQLAALYKRHLAMVDELPGEITELPEAPSAGLPEAPVEKAPEETPAPAHAKKAREAPAPKPESKPAPEAAKTAPEPDDQIDMDDLLKNPAEPKPGRKDPSRFGKLYFGANYDISRDG